MTETVLPNRYGSGTYDNLPIIWIPVISYKNVSFISLQKLWDCKKQLFLLQNIDIKKFGRFQLWV